MRFIAHRIINSWKISSQIRVISYNFYMARGWESKSVEAQMETAKEGQAKDEKRPLNDAEKKARHEQDSLKLSRAYVQHQIESSTNERYTESLRRALSEIDQKIAQLKDGH